MNAGWTDIAQAVCAIATVLLALVGIPLLAWQLRQVERSIQGDTQEKLFSREYEILALMASTPQVRAYILDGKRITDGDPDGPLVRIVVAMMADFCELVWLQRANIDGDIWPNWASYLHDLYARSGEIRCYLADNPKWYTPGFLDFMKEQYPDKARSNKALHATSEPAPGAASSSHEG